MGRQQTLAQQRLVIDSTGRGTYEITQDVAAFVAESGIETGLCNIFVQHTSASLIICENADADVRRDLEMFMSDLVADGDSRFVHVQEGPDDMSAHIRSVLTQTAITIPVQNGQCALGTWQGIYLWEHRHAAHQRAIMLTVYG